MQVVSGMDESDTGMGNLLVLLHTFRVRVLQGSAREALHTRHRRPGSFPRRHYSAILRCLQRQSDLSNGL